MESTEQPAGDEVSTLLRAWSGGDPGALEQLTPIVYDELHRLARRYMKRERPGHSLQTTALVNEAYTRLVDYKRMQWQDRAHFFAVSAQLMRRILVEHARRHNLKRGGGVQHVSLDEATVVGGDGDTDLVALDDAMNALARLDPRKVQVVEMRFFGGLSVEETAEVLKVSPVTVKRDWRAARTWLYRELTGATNRWTPNAGNKLTTCCSRRWTARPRSATRFCARRARAMRRWSAKSVATDVGCPRRRISGASSDRRGGTRLRWRRNPSGIADWADHLPLPSHREAGRRRNGSGVQGRRSPPPPFRRAQIFVGLAWRTIRRRSLASSARLARHLP